MAEALRLSWATDLLIDVAVDMQTMLSFLAAAVLLFVSGVN